MRELKDIYKTDKEVMRLLKVKELRHLIAGTDKGDLSLMIRKDEPMTEYRFVLDAVPVSDEVNNFLLKQFNKILFIL